MISTKVSKGSKDSPSSEVSNGPPQSANTSVLQKLDGNSTSSNIVVQSSPTLSSTFSFETLSNDKSASSIVTKDDKISSLSSSSTIHFTSMAETLKLNEKNKNQKKIIINNKKQNTKNEKKTPTPELISNIFKSMSSMDPFKRYPLSFKIFFDDGNFVQNDQLKPFINDYLSMISTFPAIQDFKDQIQDIGIGIEKIRVTPQNLANKDNLISVQNHARLSFDLPKIFLKDNIIKYLKACFISSAIHHPFTVIDDHIEENQNLVLLEINFPPYLNKDFFKSVSQHLLKPYGEIIHQQDAPIDTNSAFNCKSFDLHKPKTSFFIFKATMNSLPPSTNFVPRAPD
ncbi:hypothetical protein C6P42_004495, partial [Pichia californica]